MTLRPAQGHIEYNRNMKINPKIKDGLKDFLMEKIQKEQGLVTVFSADSLDDDEKKSLEKKFRDINWNEAEYEIDKSVIAGIIIKAGSKTVDLSLSGMLSKLSNTLYEIDWWISKNIRKGSAK